MGLILEKITASIAPNDCVFCHAEGKVLCDWCEYDALPIFTNCCYKCGASADYRNICDRCHKYSQIERLFIRTNYNKFSRKLIHSMKFKYSVESAKIIANQISNILPAIDIDILVTNIPSISSHVKARGFDHTKMIAKELSKIRKLRYVEVLKRSGQHQQVGSSRADRIKYIKGSFRIKKPYLAKNTRIILIDDLITTGATVDEAVRTLKQSGAKTVYVAVLASKN